LSHDSRVTIGHHDPPDTTGGAVSAGAGVGAVSWVGTDGWLSAGADSWLGGGALSAGAPSWLGAGSGVGVGASLRGAADSEDSLDGACGGGCTWRADPPEPAEEPPPRERVAEAPDLFSVRPGKALAATSANTPVSATDPAINQRLTRFRRCNAASLALAAARGIKSSYSPSR
jgi:hypothetical protein